jgi:hypothetical protein
MRHITGPDNDFHSRRQPSDKIQKVFTLGPGHETPSRGLMSVIERIFRHPSTGHKSMNAIVQSPIPLIGYYEDASISCLAFASRRRLDGMFANYRGLFRELDEQHRLRKLDPLLARDIGVAVGCDWRADGSPADLIPLLMPRLTF